ncbi:MAG: hypothetical protein U0168_04580 [Nannocystaceae bacterium]
MALFAAAACNKTDTASVTPSSKDAPSGAAAATCPADAKPVDYDDLNACGVMASDECCFADFDAACRHQCGDAKCSLNEEGPGTLTCLP